MWVSGWIAPFNQKSNEAEGRGHRADSSQHHHQHLCNHTIQLIGKVCKKYQPVSAISIKASIPSPLSHDQKIVHNAIRHLKYPMRWTWGTPPVKKNVFFRALPELPLSYSYMLKKGKQNSGRGPPPNARKKTFFYRRCFLNFIVYTYTFFLGNVIIFGHLWIAHRTLMILSQKLSLRRAVDNKVYQEKSLGREI